MLTTTKQNLIAAEKKAQLLFDEIEKRGLIAAHKTERQLNTEIFELAFELFGIDKYWHKRIVRAGANTLCPYRENPPDLVIQEDDVLFFDFGPVFEDWEADFGRTYVLGNDPIKHKLKNDTEAAWHETKAWFDTQTQLTGAQLYAYTQNIATKYGWTFGGEIAGHLIGLFPHEKLAGDALDNYVHRSNDIDMFLPDKSGNKRDWILEIHLVDVQKQIGGFFEQLLT
ncbi:MAG: aminopeptidase P family protein [Chitinophagales bacterium]|nr:aminopeptidase P family protein [Chitinophagales bacterium]